MDAGIEMLLIFTDAIITGPSNCTDFVANNPSNFTNAYWEFGSFQVYQASNST